AASVALFVLAAAVKETAVTLPAALLLVEACSARSAGWRAAARRQAAHWLVLPAAALGVFFSARYRDLLTYGFNERGALDNLRAQAGGVGYLLARLVTLRGFNIDPGLVPAAAWTPLLAAQAALIAGLLALGLACVRRRPWLGFGALWFFLQLAPTNSVVPRLDLANDRQLYLACWGPFLALTVEASRLRVPRRALLVAAAALLALFAAAALARQREFWSETALWEASLRENADNARAHNNLGQAYEAEGRREQARAQYREALRLRPDYTKAGVNLRLLDWDEAERAQRDSNSGTTQRR
ncbi:MAG: tetratricopeptide repeat protein, partial [Elusimicrobia bacterium]|nr:tetratricopeptide repeat protein [Elusimicrobiota bacterium]